MAHEQWLLLALVGLGMGLQAMAKDFDFYYYVSQWPGSYCAQSGKGCCLPTTGEPDENFFIVGLYATTSVGAVLRKCPNEQSFDFSKLEDLEESLSDVWSSIKCPSNNGQSMWKSLWKNNGVCSNLGLFEYFVQGIIIHREINLIKALRIHGIVPDGRLYQLADIKKALKIELGEEVGIRCSTNLEGNFQLYEVYVCIDKHDATSVIPCPSLPNFKCSDEIRFPTFNIQMLEKNVTSNSLNLQIE
ncbi:hypothetical protein AMTRI_Chr05g60880 [Amborella trichopoda]